MGWLLTFLGIFSIVFIGQEHDVKALRQLFYEGSENQEKAELLFKQIGEYSGPEAILIAYKAGAYALKAKYGGNPINKLRNIKKAQRYFTEAVQKESNNLEIRFMRYSVEFQTPGKLNLSKHLEEDKQLLLNGLRQYPNSDFTPETARVARDYLRQNCTCTAEEKQFLEQLAL